MKQVKRGKGTGKGKGEGKGKGKGTGKGKGKGRGKGKGKGTGKGKGKGKGGSDGGGGGGGSGGAGGSGGGGGESVISAGGGRLVENARSRGRQGGDRRDGCRRYRRGARGATCKHLEWTDRILRTRLLACRPQPPPGLLVNE